MLYHLIMRIQRNDTEAMLEMIHRFRPLLRHQAYELKSEDALEMLIADFLEILCKINLDRLEKKEDAALVNYIKTSLNRSRVVHSRKQAKITRFEVCMSALSEEQQFELEEKLATYDQYDDIAHAQVHEILTEQEMKVLLWTCVHKYSSAEIARRLGVSRQNVNQTKKRALKKAEQHYRQFQYTPQKVHCDKDNDEILYGNKDQ